MFIISAFATGFVYLNVKLGIFRFWYFPVIDSIISCSHLAPMKHKDEVNSTRNIHILLVSRKKSREDMRYLKIEDGNSDVLFWELSLSYTCNQLGHFVKSC